MTFISLSCEDNLPTYVEPANVFNIFVRFTPPDPINYRCPDVNDINTSWVLMQSDGLEILIGVMNIFDETLQDEFLIRGRIEMEWERDQRYKFNIQLNEYNASASPLINWNQKLLTIDTNQIFFLKTKWNYKCDNDKWAFSDLEAISVPKSSSSVYRVHTPMIFTGYAYIQFFKHSAVFKTKKLEVKLNFLGLVSYGH